MGEFESHQKICKKEVVKCFKEECKEVFVKSNMIAHLVKEHKQYLIQILEEKHGNLTANLEL